MDNFHDLENIFVGQQRQGDCRVGKIATRSLQNRDLSKTLPITTFPLYSYVANLLCIGRFGVCFELSKPLYIYKVTNLGQKGKCLKPIFIYKVYNYIRTL